ncbi:metallophosphoesterase [bacterium]|nr:metallophosphoesterase [bacterium]
MKIAVTADPHLTSLKDHPERYHAMENILDQMLKADIYTLIIAGDLFHADFPNYAEFDDLCQKPDYRNIQFHIIPGNHDSQLHSRMLASDNTKIYSKPAIQPFDLMSLPFLFLPYQKNKNMGEVIASFHSELSPNEWILIGHGDWIEGMRESNPFEPGVYMPLTRSDVERFRPAQVVLGHIHKPLDRESVHYLGSPCGLDITETGKRRFLVIDSENGSVESKTVDTDLIFFDESFIILPVEDEAAFIKNQVLASMKAWQIVESEKKKVKLRVRVNGYCRDKHGLMATLKACVKNVSFYQDEEPDLSGVSISDDVDRAEITRRVLEKMRALKWPQNEEEPGKEEMMLEALHVIYGD